MAKRLKFNCDLHDPVVPNKGHHEAHRVGRLPGSPCFQSLRERSAYKYLKRNGTLEGWKGYQPQFTGKTRFEFDCEATGPIVPNATHWQQHKRDQKKGGPPPCERSAVEMSAYTYQRKHGDLVGWDSTKWAKGRMCKHIVYKIMLINGDWYYGITSWPLAERLRYHIYNKSAVGVRLDAGELSWSETLCELPNRMEAEEVERLMIRSGNPYGILINKDDNPWHGQPAPHFSPA